ncbi:hypothetical protein QBC41DRAFT_338519 [Cercophora samala]|uniref:Rhodopsin domain-containing protein n=1 Tax=Cercophora samala TaxID=330535 RepID=A0AA40D8K5_9PEZI|nr:hypothetical protein QBC41DRAFT_338519 [Cercophora samala]
MSENLNENGVRRLTVTVVCLSIAVVATFLRFWCKIGLKQGIHGDDWFILATTISYIGAASASLWGLFEGSYGKEIGEIMAELAKPPSLDTIRGMENFLMSLFIANTILYLTFYLAKISILLLYRRIFSTPEFRKICLIMIGISTAYFIAAQVANLCICIPIDLFWHRTKPGGRCLNFNLFSFIIGLIEIVLDIAILALPIKAVLSLQMPKKTKAMVSAIFLLGGFAIITSILRVAYQYQPNSLYVSFSQAEFWLNIHTATVILCACLPVYKPLRSLASAVLTKLRDSYGSSIRRLRGSGSRSKLSDGGEVDVSHAGNMELPRYYYPYTGNHPSKGSAKELINTASSETERK